MERVNTDLTMAENAIEKLGVNALDSNSGKRAVSTAAAYPIIAPIYQYHARDQKPERYFYSPNPTFASGWVNDGVAFFSFGKDQFGVVPIYQYHAENPWRYFYSPNPKFSSGWINDGVVFYAFKDAVPNSMPVYQYHAEDPWRYVYSTDSNLGSGWINDGIVFQTFAAIPAN